MRIFTIPNAITSMNLLCGILGVMAAVYGAPGTAFLFMLGAAVFDFFDGLSARLLHSVSPIGKELDSLSDMVSFGVLPALLLVKCMENGHGAGWLCLLPLFLAVMSAYRLAKFNLDERQATEFIGLPTPAAALVAGSFAVCAEARPESLLGQAAATPWFLPLFSIALGLLLVSEIPMFSMKVAKGHKLLDTRRIVFFCLAACSLLWALFLQRDGALALLLIFGLYIVENIAIFGLSRFQKNR